MSECKLNSTSTSVIAVPIIFFVEPGFLTPLPAIAPVACGKSGRTDNPCQQAWPEPTRYSVDVLDRLTGVNPDLRSTHHWARTR